MVDVDGSPFIDIAYLSSIGYQMVFTCYFGEISPTIRIQFAGERDVFDLSPRRLLSRSGRGCVCCSDKLGRLNRRLRRVSIQHSKGHLSTVGQG